MKDPSQYPVRHKPFHLGSPQTQGCGEAYKTMQKALRSLEQGEIVAGVGGAYRIVEPFLAEWINPA